MKRLADLSKITRAEWLALRQRGIGSSDAAAVLGVSRYSSPFALYCEKLGLLEERPENDAMRWGRLLEPLVAAEYARETGRLVEDPRVLLQHPTIEYMLATPDRYAQRGGDTLVVEIKTTHRTHADEWTDAPPLPYQVQLQHLLAVTGFDAGSLVVLIGGQALRWLDVERNERFIAAMLDAEAEFWRRVTLRDPPPADGMGATRDALHALFPRDTGETIALPNEALQLDRDRLSAKAQIVEAQAAVDFAENRLKALLGTASRGVLPDGTAYAWTVQRRAEYTVPALEFRVLRRKESRS